MISLNVIPNIQLVVLQFLYYIRWLKNQKAPSPSYEIYFDNLEFKRIGFFVKSIELYSGRVKRYFYKVQRKAFNQFTIILQSSYLIVYIIQIAFYGNSTLADQKVILEELDYYLHQIDNANDFVFLDGFNKVVIPG